MKTKAMEIVDFIRNNNPTLKEVGIEFGIDPGYNDWNIYGFILENTGLTITQIKKAVLFE